MKFKDKVVWITGGSSGIGEALAYEFTRQGAKTILSSNVPEDLERVREACIDLGGECEVIEFDLLDTEGIKKAARQAMEQFGGIDVLINNGGISHRSLTHETDIDFDRKILEIDFFSYVIITKEVLPHMIERGGGHIAATSSLTGLFGFPLRSAYAAAKHAVKGFFETIMLEYREKNIYVTLAYPGRIKTNISLHALTSDGKPQGSMDKSLAKGLPVDKCAKKYVNAIYRKKRSVLIGRWELAGAHFKRYWPWFFYRFIGKFSTT